MIPCSLPKLRTQSCEFCGFVQSFRFKREAEHFKFRALGFRSGRTGSRVGEGLFVITRILGKTMGRTNRIINGFAAFAFIFFTFHHCSAEVLVSDSFDYDAGSIDGQDGGIGLSLIHI